MRKALCWVMILAFLAMTVPLSIAEDLSIQEVTIQDESLPDGDVEGFDDEGLDLELDGVADDIPSFSIEEELGLSDTSLNVEGMLDLSSELPDGLLEGEIPLEAEVGAGEAAVTEQPYVGNEAGEGDLRFDFYYYVIEDGKAVITDVEKQKIYDDDGRLIEENKLQYVSVNIPEAIDGCPVTRIGRNVFADAKNLQSVTLPGSLKEIGWGAFDNCEALSNVTLPAGLEMLDCFAFNNCHSLTKINIPINVHSHEYVTEHAYSGPFVNCENLREVVFAEGMTSVPRGIFFRCPGIQDITIPDTVNKIERGAFEECNGLVSMIIPESVKEIDDYAFAWSESMKFVKLPSGLTSLGIGAFKGCKALEMINIPANAKMHDYCGENYMYPGPFAECSGLRTVIFDNGISVIPHGMFYQCDGIQVITIPDTVESIEGKAFQDCAGLVTVTISDSVKRIDDYAFAWSESLENARLSSGLTYLGIGAFKGCKALSTVNIPAEVKTHGYCAENYMYPGPFAECSGLRTVTFNEGISVIPRGLFYKCDGLREITIPDSVTAIEYEAFYNCVNLQKIKFGNKLQSIGDEAFLWCESLKSAKLPASLTYLGLAAFKGCKALQKINIPANVYTHENCGDNKNRPGPFSECSGLRTVTFAKGIKSIPNGLFYQCNGIQKITIPNTVVKIGEAAFCVCDSLTQVKIGKKVKEIEDYAFSYNPKLTSVNLPDSLTSIGGYAFDECVKLKKVVLPAKLTYIGVGAYRGCTSLSKINIPAKLKTDSWCGENKNYPGPFALCKNLKTVTFAKGIKVIPRGLFYQCDGIEKITLPDSIVTLQGEAFCCCGALTEIHIGANITDIGDYAFYGCDNFKNVYYVADKASWEKINIGSDNEKLKNAKFHYGKKVTGIKLNKKGTITMQKKETLQLEATFTPKGAKSRLVWKSSDSTIAKVNQDGMVTAVKNGQATITVTTANGKSVSVKIVVAPVCRALLVGEAIYEDGNSNLRGVYTDIDNMEKMLKNVKGPGGANWQITKKANLKAKDIMRWIKTAFKDADKDDISLFYFGGHGAWKENLKKTALCATDITFPVDNLVDPLNAVPGKMIIIVDACHSGGMIQTNGRRESDIAPELAAIDGGIVDAFSRVDRIQSNYGEFRSNKFYVLTACQYDETSICNIAFGGFFTWWLIEGMNIDSKTKAMKADNNRNKQVTLSELYDFIAAQGPKTVSWDKNHIQHVQVYPKESSFVMFQK